MGVGAGVSDDQRETPRSVSGSEGELESGGSLSNQACQTCVRFEYLTLSFRKGLTGKITRRPEIRFWLKIDLMENSSADVDQS